MSILLNISETPLEQPQEDPLSISIETPLPSLPIRCDSSLTMLSNPSASDKLPEKLFILPIASLILLQVSLSTYYLSSHNADNLHKRSAFLYLTVFVRYYTIRL